MISASLESSMRRQATRGQAPGGRLARPDTASRHPGAASSKGPAMLRVHFVEGTDTLAEMRVPFTKMHGNGNDFVLLDDRDGALALSPERLRRLVDALGGTIRVESEEGTGSRFQVSIPYQLGAAGPALRVVSVGASGSGI